MKNLIKTGGTITGLSLLLLAYNFFNMYGLISKCPEDIDLQPCQAYDNWELTNRVGFVLLAIGIILLTIAVLKRQFKK